MLAPPLQALRNTINSQFAYVYPEPDILAAGVAQGQIAEKTAREWASYHGSGDDAFTGLIDIANTGPPLASALTLLRRGVWLPAQYETALNRQAIEHEWYAGLLTLQDEWLSPQNLAVMAQRGIVSSEGLLPIGPPTTTGKVPPMPMIDVDPIKEAAGSGYNKDRLAGLTRIIGLPASPDLAARMVYRGIIDEVDFYRAIAEGNTRNEWAPFLFDGFRQIPTAHEGIESRLRGWIDDAAMYAQTARHGMSQADTDLIFKVLGRPLSFHQVFIGLRRGGIYDGPTTDIDPAFLKSLQESNIRPEWYNLAWAQRYTYPAAFILRQLTESGDLTETEAHDILLYEGWEPTLAAKVSAKWAATTTTTGTSPASKAKTSALTALHKSYVNDLETDTSAAAILTALGIADAEQTATLDTWKIERSVIRKALTATQIKKSIGQPGHDQAWATDRLLELGYSAADAATFLAE